MRPTSFVFGAALTASAAVAQVPPSVLDLQASYHVGIYGGTISMPSGAIQLLAQVGDMTLQANGALSGALDTFEVTAAGTAFTPNDPFAGSYYVHPDSAIDFDFDPLNPGTDVVRLWTTTSGNVVHTARSQSDPEALSVLAMQKSSGLSLASLSGDYYFTSQRMELATFALETTVEWGVATFDGAGGLTFAGTEQQSTLAGTTTTAFGGSGTYTVAADGAITLAGSAGGMTADGELLFAIIGETSSSEVGMTIAVRIGSSYSLASLAGRYGIHGHEYAVGAGPTLPRTTTEWSELLLSDTGLWQTAGIAVEGTAQNLLVNSVLQGGTATISPTGLMTLSNTSGTTELGFSANGDYCVGRVVEPFASLFFGARMCGSAAAYGTATAGTGGEEPLIGMKTFPTIGNANWALTVSNGIGGGIGVMAISLSAALGIPALGGALWIDPTFVGLTPLLLLNGTPGVAGNGSGQTTIPLPATTTLVGTRLYAQALLIDPGAPADFAMTSGFQAEICR